MIHARDDYTTRIQDSHGKIPYDEPVLLVRGQDVLAIPTLNAYIAYYEKQDGGDPEVIRLLEEHRERIAEWQRAHPTKVADLPNREATT